MTTAGIICEFNPFHTGHAYLIRKARRLGADRVVCLMSGDYVQRGEPAVWDRHVRARMALLCGADLVLSYPTRYSASSAESFGEMAVRILNSLNCIDLLVFGSESGDIGKLSQCADLLAEEPAWYKEKLKAGLKEGLSFPKARAAALPDYAGLLSGPNEILGIEYLKAIRRCGASFGAAAVQRRGAGHLEGEILKEDGFPSASGAAIRKALKSPDLFDLPDCVFPPAAFALAKELMERRVGIFPEDFSAILLEKLWKNDSPEFFASYEGVSLALARTILRERNGFTGWEDFAGRCASRSLTVSHVSRALLSLALELGHEEGAGRPLFTQVLGFREEASDLLASILAAKQGEMVVNPAADAKKLMPESRRLFEEEIRVSNLYEAIEAKKAGRAAVHEYARPLIKLSLPQKV